MVLDYWTTAALLCYNAILALNTGCLVTHSRRISNRVCKSRPGRFVDSVVALVVCVRLYDELRHFCMLYVWNNMTPNSLSGLVSLAVSFADDEVILRRSVREMVVA